MYQEFYSARVFLSDNKIQWFKTNNSCDTNQFLGQEGGKIFIMIWNIEGGFKELTTERKQQLEPVVFEAAQDLIRQISGWVLPQQGVKW